MQVAHLQRAFPDSADSTRFAPGRRLVPRLVGIGGAHRPRSSVFKERASGVSEFRMKCSVFVLRFYSCYVSTPDSGPATADASAHISNPLTPIRESIHYHV